MPNTVTLNWSPRFDATGYRLYRATSPINVNSLPAPLATLAGDVTSYSDATVADDTTYYYVLAADNSESPAATVYTKGQVATEGAGGGGGPTSIYFPAGFRADRAGASNQTLPTAIIPTIHPNVLFDDESGYDNTTGIYTVPASLNDQFMIFEAHWDLTAFEIAWAMIQLTRGGADTYIALNRMRDSARAIVTSGPIQVATGDQFTAELNSNTVAVAIGGLRNYFAGYTV